MTAAPSQVERVLALLRERAGAGRGVNTTELQELPVADGGRPILRLAARVHQLRERGFVISGRRERNGTQTYVLLAEPEVERASSAEHKVASPSADKSPARLALGGADTPPRSAAPAEPLAALFDTSGLHQPLGYAESEAAA